MMLQPGKLPAGLLAELLAKIPRRDPRVLLGPGIGRDAAVIDFGERMLVAKTDPVTFAAEDIGWYAVNVNANDIACTGARPAWFLATALLPPGSPESVATSIFDQLLRASGDLGIELVGGHTEITLGLDRPIVVGAMLGEASRDEIVLGTQAQPGDRVLLTKGIAIEGTSLLARESPDELAVRGVEAKTLQRARAMLYEPGISIVREAQAICGASKPRLLHDPTEGGIATALRELAEAAGATIRVELEALPVFPETRAICAALGLDPLGLLASGALLAVVSQDDCDRVISRLTDVKINASIVGIVEAGPATVIIGREDSTAPLPQFERDELARFYENTYRGRDGTKKSPEGT